MKAWHAKGQLSAERGNDVINNNSIFHSFMRHCFQGLCLKFGLNYFSLFINGNWQYDISYKLWSIIMHHLRCRGFKWLLSGDGLYTFNLNLYCNQWSRMRVLCSGVIFYDGRRTFAKFRSNFRVRGLLCGEFTGHRWIPTQRPVTRRFDVFFDLHLNQQLSQHWRRRWFETPSRSLWHHRNGIAFRFTSSLWGESISDQRIPLQWASDV